MKWSKIIQFSHKIGLSKTPAIIQAPMAGGITTPDLVAAVSEADGLGSFATGYLTTEQTQEGIRAIKLLTKKPFAVNLFMTEKPRCDEKKIMAYQQALNSFRRQLDMPEETALPKQLVPKDNLHDLIEVIVREKVPIVSFTFGNLPSDLIVRLKKENICLMGTATSVAEAKILDQTGVDVIVAQGYEAGGHRGTFFSSPKQSLMGTMALIPQIVKYTDKAVVAAGGIMNAEGVVAAMALGAVGVQMGTAFLTVKESGATSAYRDALLACRATSVDETTLTEIYTGKPARGLQTAFIEQMEKIVKTVPAYPVPHVLSSPVRKAAAKQGRIDVMSLWAGQGVSMITEGMTATDFLKKLHTEIEETMKEFSSVCSKK